MLEELQVEESNPDEYSKSVGLAEKDEEQDEGVFLVPGSHARQER